ncbi:threonine/serine exporter family protein [Weissella paramesenteroides]|uniref:threonine/serine ThrE exporter family protein n=1 Tax=Weissella paramesenteroides TaxID=1249 RepID=UPI001238DADA|nr:threonine/serine exporter family protein [Weissella paramesenteroides]KAA8440793.1 threonine/serine exporter family protein [Weissella paramesenteroides]KAA8443224.1 threonine/serine exporter family protein [Weissella paramesenteroides]KAA8445410.1 threonine/serine exporter family protein [Weissella paramesenteroides]KAA8448799.1 threonine/serine exporter family protein [Weissella paramesenteroides]
MVETNDGLVANHMQIPWRELADKEANNLVVNASLKEKTIIVGRVGLIMLSCGTGAWRVREAMNTMARILKVYCSADIGLISISYTCFDDVNSYTESLSLKSSGVNTDKLTNMQQFVTMFQNEGAFLKVKDVHRLLDRIDAKKGNYTPILLGLAAALACCSFVFLLGGGPVEMLCTFFGAGLGNYTRAKMNGKHLTMFAGLAAGVAVACLTYLIFSRGLELLFHINVAHEAGYIGAMLFAIPGFPFITSGLDLAKSDMRSGIERLVHAISIIVIATLVGWLVALASDLKPDSFLPLGLGPWLICLFRIPASFCGVFGFSVMFNSPVKMAATAGLIGAVANTLRLELVDLTPLPAAAAAFIGALTAGILASLFHKRMGYPRISLTVPAIVIMVPGLYMYRAMYYIGVGNISNGAQWFVSAMMIVLCLPLGLIVARMLMDRDWRHAG